MNSLNFDFHFLFNVCNERHQNSPMGGFGYVALYPQDKGNVLELVEHGLNFRLCFTLDGVAFLVDGQSLETICELAIFDFVSSSFSDLIQLVSSWLVSITSFSFFSKMGFDDGEGGETPNSFSRRVDLAVSGRLQSLILFRMGLFL